MLVGRRRRRRGVSTIIAELMMLAIVVGLGTLVYAFSSAAFSNFGSGFSFLVGSSGDKLQEQYVVEQVAFSSCPNSAGHACLYVRNVGNIGVTISAVYVYNITADEFVGTVTENVAINSGAFAPLPVTLSHFTPGDVYRFDVVSTRGNSVVVNEVA